MITTQERRLNDLDWRGHIDRRLNDQDAKLIDIKGTLDGHIKTTDGFRQKVEPVAEAMETMKGGIKVIGWIGSKITAIGLFLAALVGAFAAWKGIK